VVRVPNLPRALRELGERGYWRLGADGGADVQPYWAAHALWAAPAVLVLGSEEHGLRPGVRSELDQRLRIPMRGRVESLNVAAAAAVLLFDAVRSRESSEIPTG
jgi:23S rRNA (guanosine2251-2'-O)-methyltransferase